MRNFTLGFFCVWLVCCLLAGAVFLGDIIRGLLSFSDIYMEWEFTFCIGIYVSIMFGFVTINAEGNYERKMETLERQLYRLTNDKDEWNDLCKKYKDECIMLEKELNEKENRQA